MQQRVATGERRASRPTGGAHAPAAPRKRVSTAARIFYLMRWTYHFITPLGMIGIVWGILEAANGDPTRAGLIIGGSAAFTYLANYFNKAR
ncbi:MAG: hypothetical protein QCI82_00605 [Candidatus Thermoplasmatota archaeon]|nr:hypothetical protein [Candidatus Thermoplasmatota archaeon]